MSVPSGIGRRAEPQPIIDAKRVAVGGPPRPQIACYRTPEDEQPGDRIGDRVAAQPVRTRGQLEGECPTRLIVATTSSTATARLARRPVPAAAIEAIAPTAPSSANTGWRRTRAITIDPSRLTAAPVTPHPPTAESVGGGGGMAAATGPGPAAPRPAQHRAPPRVARQPAHRERYVLWGWCRDQKAAGAELDRHVVTQRRRPIDRDVTDDDGHPAGELEDRHRAVHADVEHGVMRLDVRVCETHRGAPGAADEVAAGTEAYRRTDGRPGDLDDHHQRGQRCPRRFDGARRTGEPVDSAPGSDARPDKCRRRVDLDAVDHHTARRVDADGTGELANGHRDRIRPQLVGAAVGSGHDEACWSTESHADPVGRSAVTSEGVAGANPGLRR